MRAATNPTCPSSIGTILLKGASHIVVGHATTDRQHRQTIAALTHGSRSLGGCHQQAVRVRRTSTSLAQTAREHHSALTVDLDPDR